MIRYAESADCRMSALVRHFGDIADGQKPCAICDFCAPAACVAAAVPRAQQGRARGALEGGGGPSQGRHEVDRQAAQ